MKKTLTLAIPFIAAASAPAVTLLWDFEGGGTGTLGDTTGSVFFQSSVDPNANDTAWSVGGTGITQAIPYAGLGQIDGEHNNRAANNDWFLRSDHAFDGTTTTKPGDGDTGILRSDTFLIDTTSAFSFFLGGGPGAGGATDNAFVLRSALDDSAILTAVPAANGHIYRTGGLSQANNGLVEWSSGDLAGAGITGQTEVYLSIEDNTTGGWGHIQVDDITVTNATVIPEPTTNIFASLCLGLGLLRRRR